MQAPGQIPDSMVNFDLDKYRNFLERLQQSKRNQERLDKKLPSPQTA